MKRSPEVGDHVAWNTSQGPTDGTVTGKVTRRARVKGHVAEATGSEPQFRVRSDRTGKEAIHRPEALRKR